MPFLFVSQQIRITCSGYLHCLFFPLLNVETFMDINKRFNSSIPLYNFFSSSLQSQTFYLFTVKDIIQLVTRKFRLGTDGQNKIKVKKNIY